MAVADRRVAVISPSCGARSLGSPTTVGRRDDRTAPRRHVDRRDAAPCRSVQAADLTMPAAALDRDLDADAPRAPGAHLLALPHPLHARPDPRRATREASATSCCSPGRSCCCASRRPSTRWTTQRGVVRWRIERGLLVARAGHGGDGYLQIDAAPRRRRTTPSSGRPARRGRGRELLPDDRLAVQPRGLHGDAVAHPRARDPRLPALAGAPRPRGVGRAVGRFAGGPGGDADGVVVASAVRRR